MTIEETKNLFNSRIETQVKVKIKNEKRFKHGILAKVDNYIFGGLDFGEYEAIFLRQPRKTLIIKLKEIAEIV